MDKTELVEALLTVLADRVGKIHVSFEEVNEAHDQWAVNVQVTETGFDVEAVRV